MSRILPIADNANASRPEGILLIDKSAGISSFGVVSRVKRMLPKGTKVGHAGTLDPFATGLLLLLIGPATRRCESMMDHAKTYETIIRLDAFTDTDDPTAPPKPIQNAIPPDTTKISIALAGMTGTVLQQPPIYSALKINGRRACDRARAGENVQLQPRTVNIYRIDLIQYVWPELSLRIECGRGTYIRSIARALGVRLQIGGYLTQLRRTRIGPYDVADARTFANLDPLPQSLYNPAAEPIVRQSVIERTASP